MASIPTHRPGRSLAIALATLALLSSVLLSAAPHATAAGTEYVSGNVCAAAISVTWTNTTTWILKGNATVPSTCTLTIQPGTPVLGDPAVRLYIDGELQANGTETNQITFNANRTGTSWGGLQFNKTARVSYLQYAGLQHADIGVRLVGNAPFAGPTLAHDTIDHATVGVHFDNSNALLSSSRINDTRIGIAANGSGSPVITANTVTGVSGALAVGIYVTNLDAPWIALNTVRWVNASNGAAGTLGTPRGGDGNSAAGILINGTSAPIVLGNAVDQVRAGRGGNGYSNPVGNGGSGGNGGGAAGIALANLATAGILGSTITNIYGGHGGDGGSGTTVGFGGGDGGAGGSAFALECINDTLQGSWSTIIASGITGGPAGNGGAGSTAATGGSGGVGGDGYGFFLYHAANGNASGDTVQNVRGGYGGNGTVGGAGGQAAGIAFLGVDGAATAGGNVVSGLTGGTAGGGATGGVGGNATGIFALDGGPAFNLTTMASNRVTSITGGVGGVGASSGALGGSALGLAAYRVRLTSQSNRIQTLVGGQGGSTGPGHTVGEGGMAAGLAVALLGSGNSSSDQVASVTRGPPGTGGNAGPLAYGVGLYHLGTPSARSTFSVTNGTFASLSDFTLYLDNYTTTTTLNTTFAPSNVAVMSAANLTVQFFLGVTAFWPNNSTLVTNTSVTVLDKTNTVLSRVVPSGSVRWIRVTNRVYTDRPTPTWNTTQVSVAFGTFTFASNPRILYLNESQVAFFKMIDAMPPSSSASPLLPWTGVDTFPVAYTDSDGNGSGVANVTLWYNKNGTGWVAYLTQIASPAGTGTFTFLAPGDGTYQFATTAYDQKGNHQPIPPAGNDTWTIVDTTVPSSSIETLPTYETSLAIGLRWGPAGGETDIASYSIQYNQGAGWVTWLPATQALSGVFDITALGISNTQGVFAFRSLARTYAGLGETKTGNDTWTLVDTVAPQVLSTVPTGNQTAAPTTITIVFSEPMNASSVEAAFSLSPSANGTFTWSADYRSLTFQPFQALALGVTYTVTIGVGATDFAGNGLAQADVFTFTTRAPPATLSLLDLWPLFVVLAVALAGVAFFLLRRRSAAASSAEAPPPPASPPKPEAAIDDIFLLYRRDGVLIKHETRRLRPDIDSDILSGMLNAVQAFVKDSLLGTEGDELNEMVLGQMHILIGRGKWLILAATITGGDMASMATQIQKCIQDMEDHNWDRLEDWDGDMALAKPLGPYLTKLIRGEYAA